MGDRARLDPAAARSEPGAVSHRHRERARQFRPSDAFDRRAGGEFLADQAIGLTCRPVIPGRCQRVRAKRGPMTGSASNPESRDSGSGANAPSRNDGVGGHMQTELDKVVTALEAFYARETYLFEKDLGERTLTHRLAVHLENQFPGWETDCDYSRLG